MWNQPSVEEPVGYGRPVESAPVARTTQISPGVALLGRILMSSIFLVSGIAKLTDPAGAVGYMSSVGIPNAHTLAIVAGCAEVAGGLAILTGLLTRIGAAGLFLYLIPTTLLFHNFWALTGDAAKMQMAHFMKNLTIMGGLALLVAFGAGRYSLDAKLRHTPKR